MHLEVLVEDQSGRILVEQLLPKLLGSNGQRHSWRTHPFRGVGTLPKNINHHHDPRKFVLLNDLPRLLQGYGKALRDVPDSAVLVVVDSDTKDCKAFKAEMLRILHACSPQPRALFRIAVEEMEAWLLGDRAAIGAAYPKAKMHVQDGYVQDSICGTWEVLADAIYPGGSKALKQGGYPLIGQTKCVWAKEIGPRMNTALNASPSFKAFCSGTMKLAE